MIENIEWNYNSNRNQKGFSLVPILNLLKNFNNPHLQLPFPIHIVGTNGKGSTLAFLKSILTDAGYKVNAYTSPNLLFLNERINISGIDITDAELIEGMKQIPQNVSFFEAITTLAFCLFAKSDADFTLIEAGLGGRLDATNVINPKLCILTSVSLDHQEFLGNTPVDIAREKLAVQKNAPFIVAKQPYREVFELAKIIQNTIVYGRDFEVTKKSDGFVYNSQGGKLEFSNPSLYGEHQIYNASNAICGIEYLKSQGFKISNENIARGLQKASWRGRFEKLKDGKIAKSFSHLEVFIDGAHNENGIETVLREIKKLKGDVFVVCSFLKRKNLNLIVPKFKGFEGFLNVVEIHSSEASYTKEELKQGFEDEGIHILAMHNYFYDALTQIPQNSKVVILGSLYLVGEVLKWNYEC
jgi:dihydrofolate synthase/folylpolyglutamate synthase